MMLHFFIVWKKYSLFIANYNLSHKNNLLNCKHNCTLCILYTLYVCVFLGFGIFTLHLYFLPKILLSIKNV